LADSGGAIIGSAGSKGKAEDGSVRAMLIIARTAADRDCAEGLIEAAGRGVPLLNLEEQLLGPACA
jgi:hypothetical protein